MKVNLLKKLRKRFYWYKDHNTCWSYYDREKNADVYAFVYGFTNVNDMLLYRMLSEIGMEHIFIKSRDKIEARQIKKADKNRKNKFAKYFKR